MKRRGCMAMLVSLSMGGCSRSGSGAIGQDRGSPTPGIRERAESIPYSELSRNIKDHEGDAVHYQDVRVEGILKQNESVQRFTAILDSSTPGDTHAIYCVYRGDTYFKRYDSVDLWGVVEGLETLETALGEQAFPKINVTELEHAD